jgi:alkylhydroperoxidase/carboxymuconolactone decarboxylase family protein YurZ
MSDERIKKLKERYRREYAPGTPHPWEAFFEENPEWFEIYQDLYDYPREQVKGLSAKDRALIITALSAAVRSNETQKHMQRAFYHGATIEEMFDTIMSGWFVASNSVQMGGWKTLHKIEEKAKEIGEEIASGKDWLLLSEDPADES